MKKAFRWLDSNTIDYTYIDVKKDPVDREDLVSLAYLVGLDTLLNKKGTTWKKEGLVNSASDDELIDWLFSHQTAIKRPVLMVDDTVLVGFDEDAYKSIFEIED